MIHRVILSPKDVAFALEIANKRYLCHKNAQNQQPGFKDAGVTPDRIGVTGELCATKVHGGKMDTQALPDGDHHVGDIILANNQIVEVKSREYLGEDVEVIFSFEEYIHFTYVCLVQVQLPDIGMVHPIWSKDEVGPHTFRKDYGYGMRIAFRPCDLGKKQC